MYLLRNNKIETISLKEDTSDEIQGIHSIKTLVDIKEQYKKDYGENSIIPEYYQKDNKAKLIYYQCKHGGKDGWMFETTHSEFSDNSGIGHGNGIYESKGEAIVHQLKSGHKVFNGDQEITK